MLNICPYFFVDDRVDAPAYGDLPPQGHCVGLECSNFVPEVGECLGWLIHFANNNREMRREAKRGH